MKHLSTLVIAICIYLSTAAQQTQLWVSTWNGGVNNLGQIWVGEIDGSNFHPVYDCDTSGSLIQGGLTLAPNGLLYGVTETGGYQDSCVICTYNPQTGVFTNIYDFMLVPDSGYWSSSGLTLASDGLLYGTAHSGGASNGGVIFTVNPTNNSYHPVHHFDPTIEGGQPMAPVYQAADGNLFGTTFSGGMYSGGSLYRFNPTTKSYTVLHHFTDSTGAMPAYGKVLQASDGKLYGMTNGGGANSSGVIYSFNLTTNTYSVLMNFNSTLGSAPTGGLMQATDGLLYGMTSGGGTYNGVLFSLNPTNNAYTVLVNFDGNNGSSPTRSLTQISTGKLLGTTSGGGTYSDGVIFSYDIQTYNYTKVYEFASGTGGPQCDVSEAATGPATAITPVTETKKTSVYPNPATGVLKVENLTPGSAITVNNLLGQTVFTTVAENTSLTLDISTLQPGMYYVNGARFVKE